MNPCAFYREELAAWAPTTEPPDATVQAHLEHCAHCRAMLQQLQTVARLNLRVAAELPEPSHPFPLATKFLEFIDSQNSSPAYPFARPALIVSAIAVCVIALLVIQDSRRELHDPRIASTETHRIESPWSPTWQRLRQQERRDSLGVDHTGAFAVAHYRVKDAYSDLN